MSKLKAILTFIALFGASITCFAAIASPSDQMADYWTRATQAKDISPMLRIDGIDAKELTRFEHLLGAMANEGPAVVSRAMNRTGDMARTQVVRALAKQTSLTVKTTRKAVGADRSSPGKLEYTLKAGGGDVSLKFFNPKETPEGVTAFVRGRRDLYEQSFLKGGSFARGRIELNMGGHAFRRDGGRLPIDVVKSGVVIPAEMVTGETAKAFDRTVARVLPRRLDHELRRVWL